MSQPGYAISCREDLHQQRQLDAVSQTYSKAPKMGKSGGERQNSARTTNNGSDTPASGRRIDIPVAHFHRSQLRHHQNAMKGGGHIQNQRINRHQYLDVGGGMAVDYDGSRTSFESSANYNAQEFANDVIYVIKTVCDDENVPHPTIIQESGRYLSAYHAMLITNVHEEIETVVEDIDPLSIDEDDPQVVKELYDLRETITAKNHREYYHDALEHREELFTMFNLGLISLEDKGKGEVLFWDVCEKADQYAFQKNMSEASMTCGV